MRTMLLAAALTAAVVLPIAVDRPPPVPLATAPEIESEDVDPIADMVLRECEPTMRWIDDGLALIQLCPRPRIAAH